MSDDLSLFDDDADTSTAPSPAPIANWQVQLLRKALDARGLTSMSERQAAIEQAAGRPVASLRDLSSNDALRTLTALGRSPAPSRSTASAWDERDEDTWIDRL